MTTSDGDYSVGYRKPPREHTWVPGQSGNRRGRPRKRRTVTDDLRDALMAGVTVVEQGRKVRRSFQALIIRRIVRDSANGSSAAQRQLLAMMARYESSDDPILDPAELDAADRAILDDYLKGAADISGAPQADGSEVDERRDGTETDGPGA